MLTNPQWIYLNAFLFVINVIGVFTADNEILRLVNALFATAMFFIGMSRYNYPEKYGEEPRKKREKKKLPFEEG